MSTAIPLIEAGNTDDELPLDLPAAPDKTAPKTRVYEPPGVTSLAADPEPYPGYTWSHCIGVTMVLFVVVLLGMSAYGAGTHACLPPANVTGARGAAAP